MRGDAIYARLDHWSSEKSTTILLHPCSFVLFILTGDFVTYIRKWRRRIEEGGERPLNLELDLEEPLLTAPIAAGFSKTSGSRMGKRTSSFVNLIQDVIVLGEPSVDRTPELLIGQSRARAPSGSGRATDS